MQVKIKQIAKIWGIETVEEFLQHLDLSLHYRYSKNVTRFARKFWDCQDTGKGEVTLLFLLDILRAFNLYQLSDLLDFGQQDDKQDDDYHPEILENQPHLIATSRIDEIIYDDLSTTRNTLIEHRKVTHDQLESVRQMSIDTERVFFLSSLDKLGTRLELSTTDQLFEVKIVEQPQQLRPPRKAPTYIGGEAYGELTLSA